MTPKERTQKHKDESTNKHGFLGVSWHNRKQLFYAYIRDPYLNKKIYCGCAKTAFQAALKYDTKAKELFGRDAITNF